MSGEWRKITAREPLAAKARNWSDVRKYVFAVNGQFPVALDDRCRHLTSAHHPRRVNVAALVYHRLGSILMKSFLIPPVQFPGLMDDQSVFIDFYQAVIKLVEVLGFIFRRFSALKKMYSYVLLAVVAVQAIPTRINLWRSIIILCCTFGPA